MGFFSRRSRPGSSPIATPSDLYIGRKFRSSLSMTECLDIFGIVKHECYPTSGGLVDVEWHTPSGLGGFESSQGGIPAALPARVVANDLADGSRIYLAIWDRMVSYGDGSTPGPPCEMWFVPPDFDTSPIPIAGVWKRRDGSLSSIGYVEAPLWGANQMS